MRPIWILLTMALALRAGDSVLPGTSPLTIAQPLDEAMVDGIHRYCDRATASARQTRERKWRRDFANAKAYEASTAGNRARLATMIGAVDPRLPAGRPRHYRFEMLESLGSSSAVATGKGFTVHAVRWQALDGLTAEGLLLKPDRIRAAAVVIPDADWTPEMFVGLAGGVPEQTRFAARLAAAGVLVAVPALISRRDEWSGNPAVTFTNQPHREFLYRQAFEMGRHPIGYEVQRVLAAVDLFERLATPPLPVGVAGVGEGALLALYAGALDPRIRSVWVSGYYVKGGPKVSHHGGAKGDHCGRR